MSKHKKRAVIDIDLAIDPSIKGTVYYFLQALQLIERVYQYQMVGELDLRIENEIYQKMIEALKRGEKFLPVEDRKDLENQIDELSRGIFDLFSMKLKRDGEEYIDLVLGKIFSFDRNYQMLYSGAMGMVNKDYDTVIKEYDNNLIRSSEKSPKSGDRILSLRCKELPQFRCIDVFALSGELNIRHKPICVFFSGDASESTSALSQLTVFINLYVRRFEIISKEIAKEILCDYQIIEDLDYKSIGKFLLMWLRGHDLGHFQGEDRLKESMSEFDRRYLTLHELKSDFISMGNLKYLRGNLLSESQLIEVYMISIAEMFRYIRRGGYFNHPDSASALLAYSFFKERGSISLRGSTNKFDVDITKLEEDINEMTSQLLDLFGEGKVDRADEFLDRWCKFEELCEKSLPPELGVLKQSAVPHFVEFNFVTREDVLGNSYPT